ncbi:hypothetical protein ACWKW4_16745, partial [Hydrogenophaga borbori]
VVADGDGLLRFIDRVKDVINRGGLKESSAAVEAALIAIDGQPPKPYRVGAELDGGVVLQSVQRRSARLAPAGGGQQGFELSLPAPPGDTP